VPESYLGAFVFSLTPTIVVGLIFWFVVRSLIRADRTERSAYSKIEAEERAKVAAADFEAERVAADRRGADQLDGDRRPATP
jgi:flagellar biosynthesis/type III secretory pathway M-ring protein FliF/YscJ